MEDEGEDGSSKLEESQAKSVSTGVNGTKTVPWEDVMRRLEGVVERREGRALRRPSEV